jgi:hypothetical protein
MKIFGSLFAFALVAFLVLPNASCNVDKGEIQDSTTTLQQRLIWKRIQQQNELNAPGLYYYLNSIHGKIKTITLNEYYIFDSVGIEVPRHRYTTYDTFTKEGIVIGNSDSRKKTIKNGLIIKRQWAGFAYDSLVYRTDGLIKEVYRVGTCDKCEILTRYSYDTLYNLIADSVLYDHIVGTYNVYTYNEKGDLTTKTKFTPDSHDIGKTNFQYENQTLLKRAYGHEIEQDEHHLYFNEDLKFADQEYFEYEYETDIQGNITKISRYYKMQRGIHREELTTYTYQYY